MKERKLSWFHLDFYKKKRKRDQIDEKNAKYIQNVKINVQKSENQSYV